MRLLATRPDGTLVCRCERAITTAGRTRGLLGRSGLDDEEGMWLVPCRSIHTFFMRFAIDVLFLNIRQEVIGRRERLRPWRMAVAPWGTASVLELAAGRIAATGLQWGDTLTFRPLP